MQRCLLSGYLPKLSFCKLPIVFWKMIALRLSTSKVYLFSSSTLSGYLTPISPTFWWTSSILSSSRNHFLNVTKSASFSDKIMPILYLRQATFVPCLNIITWTSRGTSFHDFCQLCLPSLFIQQCASCGKHSRP